MTPHTVSKTPSSARTSSSARSSSKQRTPAPASAFSSTDLSAESISKKKKEIIT